jgi:RNA polymerase sigma-70 factor (ECF subfamily)
VFGYVYCLVPNWSDADDIIQEVGVKLWQGFGKFRPGSDFVRWACTVAHYEVLTFRRRRRAAVPFGAELLDRLAEPAAEAAGELEERQDALRACVAGLPPTWRALVEMVYGEGKSAAEAARATARPAASVHSTLSQIRKQLRECVHRRLGRSGSGAGEPEPVAAACHRLSAGGDPTAALAGQLAASAAARRAYAGYMVEAVGLRFLLGTVSPAAGVDDPVEAPPLDVPLRFDARPARRRAGVPTRLRWGVRLAAAAAVVVGVVMVLRPAPRPVARNPDTPQPPPAVALVVAAAGDRWEVGPEEVGPEPGARLAAGKELRLKAGLVKLAFDGGAEVLVEGSAAFTPETGGRVRLAEGALTATVPAGAEGFTVRTANGDFVDLGTEFGVRAADGRAEAHVFAGAVEVRPAGAAPRRAGGLEALALPRRGAAPEAVGFDGGRLPAPGALDPDKPVLREYWLGVVGKGNHLDDLVAHPRFAAGRPDGREYLSAFEVGRRVRADRYGSRVAAVVRAPQTGAYTFRVAGDDLVRLSLANGPAPAGKRVIASVPMRTGFREWTAHASQVSAPVRLEAGRSYYLEAIHWQSALGDHLSVGWTLPDGTREWPIPGRRLTRADSRDPVK